MGSMQSTPSGEEIGSTSRPWEELPDVHQDCSVAQRPTQGSPANQAGYRENISASPHTPNGRTSDNRRQRTVMSNEDLKEADERGSSSDVAIRRADELHSVLKLADMPIKKITLTHDKDKEVCFLSLHFGGRVLVIETPALTKSAQAVIPKKEFAYEGATYYLTAYNVSDSGTAFWGGKVYTPSWYYVQAESLAHLEYELSEVANFAALPGPRKTVARLDLLQSTTSRDKIGWLRLEDFELIEEPISSANGEPMLDGCGFISDDMLRRVLNYTTTRADMGTRLAVQVRVIAPQLGVFKGMLMRKPGIKGVQLVQSMRKVLPSTSKNVATWAMVIVKQVYPTKGSTTMGKRFSPNGEFTPSHRAPEEKPLNDMVSMLMEGIGVPTSVLQAYKAKRHNEHSSCVVGVADPTGELPAGTVFLTGTRLTEVFVTRYPCVKVSHGHVLKMPNTKPSSMSASAWEWLHGLKFGALIFSGKGHCSLPAISAEGDLDGDLFFVCWNDEVVHHVRENCGAATDRLIKEEMTMAVPEVRSEKGQSGSRRTKASNGGWLAAAQSHMTDINVLREPMTIGAKHKAWKSAVSEHGMAHPEAEKCADAFTATIDHGKHGTDDTDSVPLQVSQQASPASGISKVAKPGQKATKEAASCNHLQQSVQFSRGDLERKKVQELRNIIDELGLNVAKNTGGKNSNRTKNDIIDDIIQEMNRSEE